MARPRVAIIDDDTSLCRSLSRLLRLSGFEPSTYASAEQFLLDTARAQFACLLVDVHLGGMSGLQMQRTLAAQGSRIPVVFMTGHDEPAVEVEAVQAGCAAFLSKAADSAGLLDALRAAVPRS